MHLSPGRTGAKLEADLSIFSYGKKDNFNISHRKNVRARENGAFAIRYAAQFGDLH